MGIKNKYIVCFLYLFSVASCYGQDNFAEAFLYFPRNVHVFQPSHACLDSDVQADLIYKTYAGKFSLIRTFYADVNLNVGKHAQDIADYRHVFGLGFYNDREGEFFSKIRILPRYAIHVPVGKDLYLAAGVSVHLLNYELTASGAGATGSDINWSGNFSTTLYHPGFKVGVSLNDFNSPQLQPIEYNFRIPRFLMIYAEKKLYLNENTEIKGALQSVWKSSYQTTYFVQGGIIFSRIVALNGFVQLQRGWGLSFELNKIKILESRMDFSAAYFTPSARAPIRVLQYELNLRYYFSKN